MATTAEVLAQALGYYQVGHHAVAEQLCRYVLEFDSQNPHALHLLGMVRFRQGCPEDAIACYRRVLELQPELAQVHNNLGNVLKSQRQSEEALACYAEALRLEPDFPEAHNN